MNSKPSLVAEQRAVSVAVLLARPSADSHVLLCQRLPSARYGLKWEFPGGKVEPGETPREAIIRELQEELGILEPVVHELHREQSEYADGGRFDVHYFLCTSWLNPPQNRVFHDLLWTSATEVSTFDILEGNRAFCAVLPELIATFFARLHTTHGQVT